MKEAPSLSGRRRRHVEVLIAAALATVSFGFWLHLSRNPVGVPVFGVASGTLPTLLVLFLFIVSAGLALFSLMRGNTTPREVGQEESDGWRGVLRVLALLALCIAFSASLRTFGYLLSGGALVLGTALLFGNRRFLTVALIVGLSPLLLSLSFEKFMVIYLPAGRLFQ